MKKVKPLYFLIIIFAFILIAQNFLFFVVVKEMNGDARVVNYCGIVRGKTQRLVKLELSGNPNDTMIADITNILHGLQGESNKYNLVYMDDERFQKSINELNDTWENLCESIYHFRDGKISVGELIDISEAHFEKADEAVHNAEINAEAKLGHAEKLVLAGIIFTFLIIAIVIIVFVTMNWAEKKQRQILLEKNRELEEAVKRADLATKAKSVFLSNMSHDIRTPLNGIIGMTNIAVSKIDDNKKVTECLESITHSSKHLMSLINDILDISKIESGKMILNNSDFSLPEFMNNLMNILQPQVKAKNLQFHVSACNVVHENLIGDVLRLNQAFINILSNSIKFTPDGGSIGITIEELPLAKPDFATFRFICFDTGIGMSEEYIGKIFDSFTREKDPRINKIEGTGLGMYITKNIVDEMGGSINITSKVGEGTQFNIVFDLEIQDTKSTLYKKLGELEEGCPVPQKSPISEKIDINMTGIRILLAEDNEINRLIACELLADTGAIVDTAMDGAECFETFINSKENDYDIIVTDIQMPNMDGYELARSIRKLENRKDNHVPIIAMTANAFDEDIKEALAAGMNAHTAKPLDFEHFIKTIKDLL